jgi:hypothetical protein
LVSPNFNGNDDGEKYDAASHILLVFTNDYHLPSLLNVNHDYLEGREQE